MVIRLLTMEAPKMTKNDWVCGTLFAGDRYFSDKCYGRTATLLIVAGMSETVSLIGRGTS